MAEASCCSFWCELSSDGAWGLGGTAYLGCVIKASPAGSQVQVPQLLGLSTLNNWFSNLPFDRAVYNFLYLGSCHGVVVCVCMCF